MTTRTVLLTTLLMSFTAATVLAQPAPRVTVQPKRAPAATPEAPPPPPPPPPAGGDARPRAPRTGQPINIKVEFTITDQRGGAPPVKRTLSVVVADSYTGLIRSQSDLALAGTVPLNVDTSPNLLADGKIRLGFNLQYDSPLPVQSTEGGMPRGTVLKTAVHQSVMLILENGKSTIAAQSADPIGDRQVTVEVKATVLR